MKKQSKLLTLSLSFLTIGLMGIAMPSCPGQQAMQTQIDALTQKATETDRKLQSLNGQIQGLSKELAEQKGINGNLSEAVLAQKESLKKFEEDLKTVTTAMSAKSSGKPAAKKKK